MQTLSEIREILSAAGRQPRRSLGQNFLIDAKLMGKLLELADLRGGETVLEVGPATGSLTEELIARAACVVAVEVDRSLAEILRRRVGGAKNLVILNRSVLAGKHKIAPEVLDALSGAGKVQKDSRDTGDKDLRRKKEKSFIPCIPCIPASFSSLPPNRNFCDLVANLPYNIAVPLIMNCLILSWRSVRRGGRDAPAPAVCFSRLTFTIQQELADRLTAGPGSKAYGPVGVIAALLSRAETGRAAPPEAFWPRPKVDSRMLRLDFDANLAGRLLDAGVLSSVLSATFGHRRKMISAVAKQKSPPFSPERFLSALAEVGIDPSVRPEQVSPQEFLTVANALSDAVSSEPPNMIE